MSIMFGRYYKLQGQSPIIAESFLDWCLWMASADTRVMVNDIYNVNISTVFVGINLDPQQSGEPMIFETLVMGGVLDGKRNHWSTWEQAMQGHLKICAQISKLSAS
ncbi:MAG: hypothetical protein V7K67_21740 [Nostoc sp.]